MDEQSTEPTSQHTFTAAGLSEWEPRQGLAERLEDRGVPLSISAVAQGLEIRETPVDKLRAATLRPIVTFFIWANGLTGGATFLLALIEMFLAPATHAQIITDKVAITLIGGLTVQVGAVIIAAFKGLFAGSTRGSGVSDAI